MGIEAAKDYVQNPIKENVLSDLKQSAESAQEKVEEKQALYAAAMKKLNIFQEKKHYAESVLRSNSSRQNKAKYSTLSAQVFNAELDADILRGSLQSSLSYSAKMNQSIFVANSMLGS